MFKIKTPSDFPITFDTIRAYQEHFCHEEELALLEGQSLQIKEIPRKLLNFLTATATSNSQNETAKKILSMMLYPIGMAIEMTPLTENLKGNEIRWDLKNGFELESSTHISLKRVQGAISIAMGDLFELMISSSRLSFTLNERQCLEIKNCPVSFSEEHSLKKATLQFHEIARGALPPGYKYRILLSNATLSITPGDETGSCKVVSSSSVQIDLLDSSSSFTFASFASRLETKGEIAISKGTSFRIEDPSIAKMNEEFNTLYCSFFTPSHFFLNHLFSNLGKCIEETGSPLTYTVYGNCIEFSSLGNTHLKLVEGNIWTRISDLGDYLVNNFTSLEKPALVTRRPLTIYGFFKSELSEIETYQKTPHEEVMCSMLDRFFTRRSPVGYVWDYVIPGCASKVSLLRANGKTCTVLQLNPHSQNEKIEFFLSPLTVQCNWPFASGELSMIGLFNRSPASFLHRFLEEAGDQSLMEMLAAKMILHYCLTENIYLENRSFFPQEILSKINLFSKSYTRDELRNLLSDICDPSFSEEDFRMSRSLMEIPPLFHRNKGESPSWELDKLSPKARRLLDPLLQIAQSVIRYQAFNDSMGKVHIGIQNGSMTPFLNPALLEEPNISSSLFN